MSVEVRVPRLDEIQETAIVTQWYKTVGDRVSKGESVANIETMKATFDIESPADGAIEEILVQAGNEAPVGALLCKIGVTEVGLRPATASLETVRQKVQRIRAVPAAKRIAKETAVDLSAVKGTGPDETITVEDVETYLQSRQQEKDYDVISLDATRREILRHMTESYTSIPAARLTMKVLADLILLEKEKLELSSRRKIPLTAIIVQKVAKTLLHHKKLNCLHLKDEWRSYSGVHICVALQGKRGLVAPVIRDAHIKDIFQLSDDLEALQKKVDNEDLGIAEVTGGTFTLTNLGPYGVMHFDAIVNAPQVAILAVGSISGELGCVEGKPASRSFMHLTLAFDHRLIDGYDAAMFLRELRENVEGQPTNDRSR